MASSQSDVNNNQNLVKDVRDERDVSITPSPNKTGGYFSFGVCIFFGLMMYLMFRSKK